MPSTSKNQKRITMPVKESIDSTYNLNGSYQPTVKRFADLSGADFYPTPEWASYALLANESFKGKIWECACGDGAISKVLQTDNDNVISTDLYDRGFGKTGLDFLTTNRKVCNIVTNPPYNSAQKFIEHGYSLIRRKMALLLRLAFLEGIHRANTIFSQIPPSRIWVFSERISFYPKGKSVKGSGTTAYAWYIWDKKYEGPTQLNWIKPGFKKDYPSIK